MVASIFPCAKKTIIFESFLGKQYSDNPKAIFKYIKKTYPEYKLFWSVDRKYMDHFHEHDLHYIKRFTPKWFYMMATAKYWITNSRLPLWIPKPKHTIYIQTWHGTPLKKLGSDIGEVHMAGVDTKTYKADFLKESGKWDYLLSPNKYSTEIFKRAFGFDKTVVESGYPRNDVLYTHNNKEDINKIKLKLNIPLHKKIILYAPTWRDNDFYHTGKYKFKLKLDLDKLQHHFADDYIILLRTHYLVAENINLNAYENFVYDYSTYNDISDLYLISDLLITDYSSVFFDYANLKRPIIFYVYDIDDYRDNLRGFYFDLEKNAPGPLAKTTEEVVAEIKRLSEKGFTLTPAYKAFYDRFCYLEDGNASKRVVKEVFSK